MLPEALNQLLSAVALLDKFFQFVDARQPGAELSAMMAAPLVDVAPRCVKVRTVDSITLS